MEADQEKVQSGQEQHAPQEETQAAAESGQPTDHIDAQRGAGEVQSTPADQPKTEDQRESEASAAEEKQDEADPDVPQDAPEGYEPQVELQPGQTGGVVERPGEQVADVEAAADDQIESDADQNDDAAVDDPDPGQPGE